jgi:hypothetical protein
MLEKDVNIVLPTTRGAKPSWSHAMRARAPAEKDSRGSGRIAQGRNGTLERDVNISSST